MKALVLAAGKSTRISKEAADLPKPLLRLRSLPVLVHNLELVKKHGIEEVWINLHYKPEMIKSEVGDGRKWGIHVKYSEENELLGTAGALKNLENEFKDETFLVLYGDNFTNCDLTLLVREHKKSRPAGTVAVFDRDKNVNSGIAGGRVEIRGDKTIEKFTEGNGPANSNWINAGIYAFEPGVFSHISSGFSDFGRDVFPSLLKKGLVLKAYEMNGFCLALDTPESYETAQRLASGL